MWNPIGTTIIACHPFRQSGPVCPPPSEKGSFASENRSLAFVWITTPLPNLRGDAGAGLIPREVAPSLLNVTAWVQQEIHWWEMLGGGGGGRDLVTFESYIHSTNMYLSTCSVPGRLGCHREQNFLFPVGRRTVNQVEKTGEKCRDRRWADRRSSWSFEGKIIFSLETVTKRYSRDVLLHSLLHPHCLGFSSESWDPSRRFSQGMGRRQALNDLSQTGLMWRGIN